MAAPNRKVLPPTYFALSLLAMVVLHVVTAGPVWLAWPWHALGFPLVLVGGALAVYGSHLFERVGTTIKPFGDSSVLVTTGPFRYSRNPMYPGMVALLAGVGLLLATVPPLAVIPVFAVLIELRFIRVEEAQLASRFEDEYDAYTRTVHRWLGRSARA